MALQRKEVDRYPFEDYTQNGLLSLEEAKKAAINAASSDQVTKYLGTWTDYKIASDAVILYAYFEKD